MLTMLVTNTPECLLFHEIIHTAQQRAALLVEKMFCAYPSEDIGTEQFKRLYLTGGLHV